VIDKREVAASFKRTIANIGARAKTKRYRKTRQPGAEDTAEAANVIEVTEFMSVAELAGEMDVSPSEVVAKCLELGMLATINQRLDMDTIATVALEFDFEVKEVAEIGADLIEEQEEAEYEQVPRPPVVTIMGHVDHGKTSLLDYIRHSNIIAGESGGITQHIGAYMVGLPKGRICFLDTPGHEAFTAMRARGAHITDLVVLVVAQDDRVMPQTIEAIDHAKAANVPIVVAINKMDLPDADAKPVMDQLAKRGLLAEEWGGNVIMFPVSAKTGEGVDKLLEGIVLSAEMLELTAAVDRPAKGVIVDARLDRGRGPIATILVREGMLTAGHYFVAGEAHGRVRLMLDVRGRVVKEAGPSVPVVVTGFSQVPQAGDSFVATHSEQIAREIARKRERVRREHLYRGLRKVHLTDLHERIREGQIKELRLVIKGDVDGSVEVLADTLEKIKSDEVAVNIIHRGVGSISESDVLLAAVSNAVVIGFHIRPDARAREIAARESVDIRLYNVIYEAEAAIKAALEGMLAPETTEEPTGRAEVRNTFRITRLGMIAGCFVTSGSIQRDNRVHLVRDGVEVFNGPIANLRRFKDDVREVTSGYECGIRLENFNDIKVGDVFEAYRIKELERKLE
jgi:translation initiation factor IF-2